jgi:nucleolar GTP-binding protein
MVTYMPSSNPFRTIIPILTAEELNVISKKNVMKTSIRGTTSENIPHIKKARKKEATRIELLSKELRERLFRIVEDFPSLNEENISGFYVDTLDIMFGVDKTRQTLGSISGSANVIWKIKREYIGKVWHSRTLLETKYIRRAAFGRMKSVVDKLDGRLKYLETIRQKMRLMPGIDLEQPTFCIAGYPNVGKSSLVNGVTTAEPEIGIYPFTTKEVTLGNLEIPVYASSSHTTPITHINAQIVDTPGILDRSLDERNDIELKALAALKTLATAIIFMFDFTQNDAINAQLNLFRQISDKFPDLPMLLLFSKADLIDESDKGLLEPLLKENFEDNKFHWVTSINPEQIHSTLVTFFEENRNQISKIMNQRKPTAVE